MTVVFKLGALGNLHYCQNVKERVSAPCAVRAVPRNSVPVTPSIECDHLVLPLTANVMQ